MADPAALPMPFYWSPPLACEAASRFARQMWAFYVETGIEIEPVLIECGLAELRPATPEDIALLRLTNTASVGDEVLGLTDLGRAVMIDDTGGAPAD